MRIDVVFICNNFQNGGNTKEPLIEDLISERKRPLFLKFCGMEDLNQHGDCPFGKHRVLSLVRAVKQNGCRGAKIKIRLFPLKGIEFVAVPPRIKKKRAAGESLLPPARGLVPELMLNIIDNRWVWPAQEVRDDI